MLGALSLCGLCSKPSERRLICAQCKTVCYCSKACQKGAWKAGHKRDCVPFNAASGPLRALFPRALSASAKDSSARSAFKFLVRLHDAGDWRGVAAEELRFSEAAAALRVDAPTQSMYAYHILGSAYQSLQSYANAVKYFKHHLELATELGDRAQEGRASCNLGIAYHQCGEFQKAIECQTLRLVIAQEQGNREAEGRAYCNLGCTHDWLGDHYTAIRFHKLDLAIQKQTETLEGEGSACGNLGNAYHALGEYDTAIEWHEQHMAIVTQAGDVAGECAARGNLGMVYVSKGHFPTALAHYRRQMALAKEAGDRDREARASANLGICHLHLNEYDKAVVCFEAERALATSLNLAQIQSDAEMNMGIALALQVRAARRSLAAAAGEAAGAHSRSWAPEFLDERVCEAARWLKTAFDRGQLFARLHMAQLAFEAGQEEVALVALKDHLSLLVRCGRSACAGCGQKRDGETRMLTCSGCRVARFCCRGHQKMASKKAVHGGSLVTGRHSYICGVLSTWRKVVKEGVPPDSCCEDLLLFLRRMATATAKDL